MNLGRASLPKYLALPLICAVGGFVLIFMARGSGNERWLMIGYTAILLVFLAYVVWLLAFVHPRRRWPKAAIGTTASPIFPKRNRRSMAASCCWAQTDRPRPPEHPR